MTKPLKLGNAVAKQLKKYRKLFEGLKKKQVHPLYFLYGPEEYLKKEFIGELLRSALPVKDRAFNLDIIYGDEFDRQLFDDRVNSFPLFAQLRVVLLRNFKALSNSHKDYVIEAAGDISDSVILIIETTSEKLDTVRLRNMKSLADKKGLSFAFGFLDDDETVERVRSRFKKGGYEISGPALDLLVESVGPNFIDLINEVDKIFLAAGDSKTVDETLVGAVVGKYRTESTFSLVDQLGRTDPGTMIRKLNAVIDGGEEPVFVLSMLLKRAILLLEIKSLAAENRSTVSSGKSLAAAMSGNVNPYYADKLRRQAAHTDKDSLEVMLTNLRWADIKLKSTQLQPKNIIEEALLASHLRKVLAYPALSG